MQKTVICKDVFGNECEFNVDDHEQLRLLKGEGVRTTMWIYIKTDFNGS